ncbi:MAG: hypothetical protein JWR07_5099 [Nevskia sp.]|nr:hypothetical protein [Nevskia sp.]
MDPGNLSVLLLAVVGGGIVGLVALLKYLPGAPDEKRPPSRGSGPK